MTPPDGPILASTIRLRDPAAGGQRTSNPLHRPTLSLAMAAMVGIPRREGEEESRAAMADFDCAIIGGGINGAGIVRDAAGRGLSVLLDEENDLTAGTP